MNFETVHFLHLAWELYGQPHQPANREALLRTAISRAYYAAFLAARNHLRDVDGVIVNNFEAHQFVINEFLRSPDARRRYIGSVLKGMRHQRNRADYDDRFGKLAKTTQVVLENAEHVIAAVGRL